MERARRRSRAEWRSMVKRWRSSGMTGNAFARKEGINVHTFAWWRSEIGREHAAPLSLVPVRAPFAGNQEPNVEVRLPSGISLRLSDSADPDWIAALVHKVLAH